LPPAPEERAKEGTDAIACDVATTRPLAQDRAILARYCMRIACPNCHAVYNVPPPLADGRRVRCARCKHEFLPQPLDTAPTPATDIGPPDGLSDGSSAEPAAAPAPVLAWPEPAAPRPPDRLQVDIGPGVARRQTAPRGSSAPTVVALAVSVLLLCGAAFAAYVWRAQVMAAWQPSQRLFQALGTK
jgi:predicted Zn finger-like uncharacterized protein